MNPWPPVFAAVGHSFLFKVAGSQGSGGCCARAANPRAETIVNVICADFFIASGLNSDYSSRRALRNTLPIRAKKVDTFRMTLRNAAFFALIGMVLLTVLLTLGLIVSVSGVVRGLIPAMALLTSLVEWVASLSVLVFFAVFHRTQ
jgi:hypothetical protein